ncbi:hypothetical protein JCM11491_003626 [Sporobolomyces phaffii]
MADILFYLLARGGEVVHQKICESRSPLIPPPPAPTSPPPPAEIGHDLAPVYTREPVPISSATAVGASTPPHSLPNPLSRSASSTAPLATARPSPRSRSQSQVSTSKPPPPLTEHALRELHLAWKLRYQSLYLRLATLLDAMRRGLRNSWAGKVTWEKCDQVRLAIIEAEFIMKRLGEAVEWCDEKGLQRLPLVALVSGKRRSSTSRPTHTEYPPSLVHLPSPLPPAPQAIFARLTVPLPPWVFGPGQPEPDAEGSRSAVELPPSYTRHYDPFKGERLITRARWEDDRVPNGADAVVLIR